MTPSKPVARRFLRKRIASLLRNGEKQTVVAALVGCSPQYVSMIARELKVDRSHTTDPASKRNFHINVWMGEDVAAKFDAVPNKAALVRDLLSRHFTAVV